MQTRVYQAGSVVYFAGDKSDRVYILKEGKAQSIFLSEETGYEAREAINVGEFFGVKSLLGDYPQEDTVQCLSDCVVIIITYEEFENLVAKNKSIIIKMLRVFSNQLRRLNKKVNKLVEKAEDEISIHCRLTSPKTYSSSSCLKVYVVLFNDVIQFFWR